MNNLDMMIVRVLFLNLPLNKYIILKRNKMKSISFLIVLILLATACGRNKPGSKPSPNMPENQELINIQNSHIVTVAEVIQTGNYSYLKLKEGNQEYWAAVSRFDAKIGQMYYYNQSMEMNDFKSKELNRTFSTIRFIEELSEKPIAVKSPKTLTTKGKQMVGRVTDISVVQAEGGISISGLFSNKSNFANKKIRISGQVIKFTPDIMKKNWVHIQDGTEALGEYDLVVTTNDVVKAGDSVTFEGNIALDKDFGYGYKYDVILEEAKVVK